jgi:hypothetical protein
MRRICGESRRARAGGARARTACFLLVSSMTTEETIMNEIRKKIEGRVLVPALLWIAGVPFGLVVLIWLLFFRGR